MLPAGTYKSKKRFLNRNLASIRNAFRKTKFDLAGEWVQAYRELSNPIDRLHALEKVMSYVYPKVTNLTPEELDTLDMEQELDVIDTTELSTDKLLESLEIHKEFK